MRAWGSTTDPAQWEYLADGGWTGFPPEVIKELERVAERYFSGQGTCDKIFVSTRNMADADRYVWLERMQQIRLDNPKIRRIVRRVQGGLVTHGEGKGNPVSHQSPHGTTVHTALHTAYGAHAGTAGQTANPALSSPASATATPTFAPLPEPALSPERSYRATGERLSPHRLLQGLSLQASPSHLCYQSPEGWSGSTRAPHTDNRAVETSVSGSPHWGPVPMMPLSPGDPTNSWRVGAGAGNHEQPGQPGRADQMPRHMAATPLCNGLAQRTAGHMVTRPTEDAALPP